MKLWNSARRAKGMDLNGNSFRMNVVERYDPRVNRWHLIAAMSTRRKVCIPFLRLVPLLLPYVQSMRYRHFHNYELERLYFLFAASGRGLTGQQLVSRGRIGSSARRHVIHIRHLRGGRKGRHRWVEYSRAILGQDERLAARLAYESSSLGGLHSP